MISYGKQSIDKLDLNAVISVLKSRWLTQGPKVKEFENKLSKYFGANYCSVVSNGTAALHLVGLALGWKKGDVVLCSSISFLAASNAALYSNATPVFVDINPHDFNINILDIEKKIKKDKKKRIKAIIATDYAGNPCEWKQLKKIAKKNKITLINDNCHAIGSRYKNNKMYAIKYADIVTHSFHPVKNITTGEGGAVLTNNKKIFEKIMSLRTHGIVRKKDNSRPWYYEMKLLGFNYRLSDLQCALGITQLKKLNKFIKKRSQLASTYLKHFSNDKIFKIQKIEKNNQSSYHLFALLIDFRKLKINKKQLFRILLKKKICLQVHYIPVYKQPFYKKKFNYKSKDFPNAENFYRSQISLPIFYDLKINIANKIALLIKKIINDNKR